MNAVGIDVPKGKSMVIVMQPLGVVVTEPFEIFHNESELKELVKFSKSLLGETKVVMEKLSSLLPEYEVVREMYDVGPIYGSQLMSEIGDIDRFDSKEALIGFTDIDPPPYQSGKAPIQFTYSIKYNIIKIR